MAEFDPQQLVQSLSEGPGVYSMIAATGGVLYVGKARNLRRRVASYFSSRGRSARTEAMVRQIARIEVTRTHTDNEALLLENNLIKSLKPRYNIQLRDDKSYPFIYLSDHQFPRLGFYRGSRREGGRFFGPFPSASSVRESLNLLQKVFPIRQCEDSVFRNRSRPCLQYQIRRCTAPCVGLIAPEDYALDVQHAVLFLEGENETVLKDLIRRMDRASADMDYEAAARHRDRIAALRNIQERQSVSGPGGDADVVALVHDRQDVCAGVTFIRHGRNLGTKHFFPKIADASGSAELLAGFLTQYYLGKPIPPHIFLNHEVTDHRWIESAFSEQSGHRVVLNARPRGLRRRWVRLAAINADDALRRHRQDRANLQSKFEALQEVLGLGEPPGRIECFDISHTGGEEPVASCVVFGPDGPVRSDYRRFNVTSVSPGDDYAAMRQAIGRRYRRAAEQLSGQEAKLPDLILVDGGKGQLAEARSALAELGIGNIPMVGVAKGESRKPGREQLFLSGRRDATILRPDSIALHLIQQIRDEAHRFAITGHRQRRGRKRVTSTLEQIPGVGDRRRQSLLKHLGGIREVARAGIDDLSRVPGISPALAKRIYANFHDREG